MIEKKQFTGKLNTDTSLAAMPEGDFLNAQNVRIMAPRSGDMSAVQPVEGTTLKPYSPISADGLYHQVVGACEDRKENRVFYFVYADSGDHKILCYDADTNTTTKIVHDDDISGSLNFQKNTYISSQLAGGTLFFTDGVNEPRKAPVDDILAGDFTVSDVTELTLFATPGMLPLTVEKIDSVDAGLRSAGVSNNMIDDAFQFSYRFLYEDGSYSVIAPYSKLVNYEDEDEVNKDAARLTLPASQSIPSRVKRVQLLYREGNTGSWFIFKQIDSQVRITDHNDGSLLQDTFYNDKIGIALADELTSKPFDLIPLKAKSLDIAKDRLFLGNLTEGYAKYYVPDLTATEGRAEPNGGVTEVIGRYVSVIWRRTDLSYRTDSYILIRLRDQQSYDGFYLVYFSYGNPNNEIYNWPDTITVNEDSLVVSQADFETLTASEGSEQNALIRAMEEYEGIYNASDPPSTPTDNDSTFNEPYTAQVLGVTDPLSITGQHFKCNGRYKVGIVFYDEYGRNAGVYTNDNLVIEAASRTYQQYYFTNGINWSLSSNDNIPFWAKSYSIVRTKNLNSDFFIQSPAGLITYAIRGEDGTYTFQPTFDLSTVTNVAVSIQSLIKDGLGYTFNEGDNVRLITSDGSLNVVLKIEAQYGKYLILENRDIGDLSSDAGRSTGLFEIFSSTGFGETFYEVGEHYLITNPGTNSRAYSTTGGTLVGDSYVKPRTTATETQINVEAMSVNDRKWDSWLQDTGRTNIVLFDAKQESLPHTIRYSNAYIQGTDTNGLSSFDLLDKTDVDERAGDITRLIYTSSTNDSSNVLLAICTSNIASIYIGQTQVIDDAGDAILATSGNVIGTVNILKGDYGTVNAESVGLADSYVYWWEGNLRKVIRYASNGLVPVSDNGIDKLLGRVAKSTWVPGGYDQQNQEYLVSLNTNNAQQLTALYDFYEQGIGGVQYNFTGVVRDNVFIAPKSSAGWYDIGSTFIGRTYEVKVAGSDIPIRIDGTTVATLSTGETYEFYAENAETIEANISDGELAYLMEKKRSWYDVDDHKKRTLVFSEITNGFVGTRTFTPDLMISLNDMFLSFKVGFLYTHDSTTYNNFYGTQNDSFISFVFNQGQFAPQIPRAIQVESNRAPYVHIMTQRPYVQSTDIIPTEFRLYDDVWYGEVRRDRLTPGKAYNEGLNAGEVLRGQFVLCYVRFSGSTEFLLRFVNLDMQADRGHKLISR